MNKYHPLTLLFLIAIDVVPIADGFFCRILYTVDNTLGTTLLLGVKTYQYGIGFIFLHQIPTINGVQPLYGLLLAILINAWTTYTGWTLAEKAITRIPPRLLQRS